MPCLINHCFTWLPVCGLVSSVPGMWAYVYIGSVCLYSVCRVWLLRGLLVLALYGVILFRADAPFLGF